MAKKKVHHHHKGEELHHKLRHEHKSHHSEMKAREYAHHSNPHMIDNRNVYDSHQQGIERIKQRKGDLEVGQHGSMSGGWEHKRMSQEMTPRKG